MVDKITSNDIGVMLKARLKKENYDIARISRWSYLLYFNNMDAIDDTLRIVLFKLGSMEDDPTFEYTKEELDQIAEMLINEEKDIIQKMNEIEQNHYQ